MKDFLFMIISLICLSSCSNHHNDKNETAIQGVLEQQIASWNKGDIDGYMKGYWNNDSLLFIGSKGPKYGYTTTLESYKKGYPDATAMGKLSFSDLKFKKLSDEYYYVTGGWELQKAGTPGGYFTLLFRKINGHWVIVADHTS